jgi:hypothetical protein
MDDWHRSDNAGSILLYTLKQDGWRKGEPVMVNDIMIRIENANGSTNDLAALSDAILSALTPASDGRAEGLREAAGIARAFDYSIRSSTAADMRAQQISNAILARAAELEGKTDE